MKAKNSEDKKFLFDQTDLPPKLESFLGRPGEPPFTRGIHPDMYSGKPWTMRQYAGFGSAHEANKRYKYLLQQGTTGLSVAFDLPTQMGRDSDHGISRGEVGRVGVAISSLEDMEILLSGIPLRDISLSMTINSTASILLAFVLVAAERSGVPWKDLRGTIQNDVLKEYVARGTFIIPPRAALGVVTDIIQFCRSEVPQWNTISISGYHIREAGSTAVQELAFTFANAITYVQAALDRGLDIDDFAPRLAFFFNCHNNFLEEVAKFRAARRIWCAIVRDRFKAKNNRSMMLRFHTQTAGSSLTAQQPLNNAARTTLQALAAVFGGTQSLHTNGYDEALGLPTEESALLALRTQQIIAHESGVAAIVDPFAGSFVVENWTAAIEKAVFEEVHRIDALGGMLQAIDARYPQNEIERSAYEAQRAVENEEMVVVGVNRFKGETSASVPVLDINPAIEEDQLKRLSKYKNGRDQAKLALSLEGVRTAGKAGSNLLPLIVEAVRSGATVGEISDSFRAVFGEHRERG